MVQPPLRRSLWLCASLLCAWPCACGSARQQAAGPDHASAQAAPAERPIPTDPFALVPGELSSVLSLRIDQLRKAPLFVRNRGLFERSLCLASEDLDWVLSTSDRALIAVRRTGDDGRNVEWLAVLSGTYAPADAERWLSLLGDPAQPAQPARERGRFELLQRGALAVSRLDAHVMVLGNVAWVQAALDAIERPGSQFAASSLRRDLGTAVGCEQQMLCALSAADSAVNRRVAAATASLGAKALGGALGSADAAIALSVYDDGQLAVLAQLPSAEAAASVAQRTKDWLWQAALLTKLGGLPDVLEDVRLQTDAARVRLDLHVSAADLAAYEQRLVQLAATGDDACRTPATAVSAR